MMCEPFLVSMRIDQNGRITEFLGMHVAKSPRKEIGDLVIATVEASRWMFRPEDPQISGFYFDQTTDLWAQSLLNTPERST